MNDAERARLERATQHYEYRAAMLREPSDYFVPSLLMGLFYLVLPTLFMVFFLAGGVSGEAGFIAGNLGFHVIYAAPFIWVVVRGLRLRKLPIQRILGVVAAKVPEQHPGRWVRIESLTEPPALLRLRLRAYLESTGGAVGVGQFGVAMCRGDQMLEWIPIPDVEPAAPDAPLAPAT